ncbi:hypothetical protein B0A48_18414 [Cryoendolithus antarcticus]|uniref:RBR-type E3 ubiquitin transferase n=1 Tax=Cryoendolithus antarcticus TaxID=1507870 RepID=A0A1V8S8A8_9PEZI|nr:hypothetical protein B0A48_18414 [Cryoendolithus antarcticus]
MADEFEEREEELSSVEAIYPEIIITNKYTASLDIKVAPSPPLLVRFVPSAPATVLKATYAQAATPTAAHIEHDVHLSHLPPLNLRVTLPDGYPAEVEAEVNIKTEHDWLPETKLDELQRQLVDLWEDLGRCQVLYSYIDHLENAASSGFSLDQSDDGCLTLPASLEPALVSFDKETKLKQFQEGTYDCGICLEPKKGTQCHKIDKCGHVFCLQCLQDCYNNSITEGAVADVCCLDPSCGQAKAGQRARKPKPLHPRELLAMGVEDSMVRRYVEMKRKKRLESDKDTVYCPREWCTKPARSRKYPPIPDDLTQYPNSDSDDENASEPKIITDDDDRLCICENPKCGMAFCKVCYKSWHGPIERCHPRNPDELSAEDKASYEYIMAHTSPCPYCRSPVQKTMGCNHMQCYQCTTHFCYLCGSWLDKDSPYQHFNKVGSECYNRLWELEEGDEGQEPEDGEGFRGARRWEQMAIEVARAADEEDARLMQQEQQVQRRQVRQDDVERAMRLPQDLVHAVEEMDDQPVEVPELERQLLGGGIVDGVAHIGIDHPAPLADPAARPPGRRRRNPFPVGPPAVNGNAGRGGAAAAVRAHERGQRPLANGRAPPRRGPNAQPAQGGHGGAGIRRRAVPEHEMEEEDRAFFDAIDERGMHGPWDPDEV